MKFIETNAAPVPAGHYSQAVIHNGLVYISGQLPIDPNSTEKKVGNIEQQTAQVLANLDAILKASGSDKNHVVKATVYVSDIALWNQVNAVYANYFGEHKPARAVVPTRELHFGYQIELEAVAAVI